jgi:hypothetical protein
MRRRVAIDITLRGPSSVTFELARAARRLQRARCGWRFSNLNWPSVEYLRDHVALRASANET